MGWCKLTLSSWGLRGAGTWRGLLVADESKLLKVPAQLMEPEQLASSRAACTAYRLLEDFGSLRPGDCVIHNSADELVGVCLIQLCRLLRLTCVSIVADTPAFPAVAERLKTEYGAVHVLKDNAQLSEFLAAMSLPKPRLALDAIGADSGRRMLRTLRFATALPNGTEEMIRPV